LIIIVEKSSFDHQGSHYKMSNWHDSQTTTKANLYQAITLEILQLQRTSLDQYGNKTSVTAKPFASALASNAGQGIQSTPPSHY